MSPNKQMSSWSIVSNAKKKNPPDRNSSQLYVKSLKIRRLWYFELHKTCLLKYFEPNKSLKYLVRCRFSRVEMKKRMGKEKRDGGITLEVCVIFFSLWAYLAKSCRFRFLLFRVFFSKQQFNRSQRATMLFVFSSSLSFFFWKKDPVKLLFFFSAFSDLALFP